jgi:anti-sigma factor RsiW
MAYVHGELDAPARAEFEAAMRDDPDIERSVAQYRELRARIQAAYAPELSEPVPEQLRAAVRAPSRSPQSEAIDMQSARAAVTERSSQSRHLRWRSMTSLAAGLVIAVGVGFFAWHRSQSVMIENLGGSLVAGGPLAQALTNQLAGGPASGGVRIGLSFLAKTGNYCRTFTISGAASRAGLACHHADRWEIRALTQPEVAAGESGYRTAGSGLPPSIIAAIQGEISGEPLDRAAEIAARSQGWRQD